MSEKGKENNFLELEKHEDNGQFAMQNSLEIKRCPGCRMLFSFD